ncbi:MAG: 30S ribosomal protein S16 [Minisyncoccia bacterium]
MIVLRLQKVGRKKSYTYRVVAVDNRQAVNSRKVKEILGWWDPKQDKFSLDKGRVGYWLKQGAQISDSCHNLLVKGGVIKGKKKAIKIKKKKGQEPKEKEGAEGTEETIKEADKEEKI